MFFNSAVLADGGRLGYLSKTAEAYSDLLSAFRGEVKATVTSALVCFVVSRDEGSQTKKITSLPVGANN